MNKKTAPKRSTSKKGPGNFGTHLMIDAYDGDKDKLDSMELCFLVLNELPPFLKMRKIITPYVVKAEENNKKDTGGYSGFVMIAESHISIHTFPQIGFASIDIYTCQGKLPTKKIQDYFEKKFNFQYFEIQEVCRGKKFAQAMKKSFKIK